MDKYYLTSTRLEELKKELEALKTKKRPEVAERLKHAKEFGDLSENSEYAEARDEQSVVEGRIFELEEILKQAVIIEKVSGSGIVNVGSTVTAKKGDSIVTYTIVGAYDSNPTEGKISDESPLGQGFLDKRVGESVTVQTPGGEVVYKITKIE